MVTKQSTSHKSRAFACAHTHVRVTFLLVSVIWEGDWLLLILVVITTRNGHRNPHNLTKTRGPVFDGVHAAAKSFPPLVGQWIPNFLKWVYPILYCFQKHLFTCIRIIFHFLFLESYLRWSLLNLCIFCIGVCDAFLNLYRGWLLRANKIPTRSCGRRIAVNFPSSSPILLGLTTRNRWV